MGIKQLKRKEVSCYKPSDLWSQEDDLVFLKWVTSKRDRCDHTMSTDLSAQSHEILNLKVRDIVFKTVDDGTQYAIVYYSCLSIDLLRQPMVIRPPKQKQSKLSFVCWSW
jgi:hypothetical protein